LLGCLSESVCRGAGRHSAGSVAVQVSAGQLIFHRADRRSWRRETPVSAVLGASCAGAHRSLSLSRSAMRSRAIATRSDGGSSSTNWARTAGGRST